MQKKPFPQLNLFFPAKLLQKLYYYTCYASYIVIFRHFILHRAAKRNNIRIYNN